MTLKEYADSEVEKLIEDNHLRAWISPLIAKCMKHAFVTGFNRGRVQALQGAIELLEPVCRSQG